VIAKEVTVIYEGSCHCGAITVSFEPTKPIAELALRRCDCTFCRKHGSRSTSDPDGFLQVRCRGASAKLYQFGLGVSDYLVCAGCGVYVGAFIKDGTGRRGTLNANILDCTAELDPSPGLVSYAGETLTERRQRRKLLWTPAVVLGDWPWIAPTVQPPEASKLPHNGVDNA
jgi:hypothetical protein